MTNNGKYDWHSPYTLEEMYAKEEQSFVLHEPSKRRNIEMFSEMTNNGDFDWHAPYTLEDMWESEEELKVLENQNILDDDEIWFGIY